MSMWDAASIDIEQEGRDRLVATARIACAEHFGFAAEALNRTEFEDRLALVADKVESIVNRVTASDPGMFPYVHASVIDSWQQDFDTLHTARRRTAAIRWKYNDYQPWDQWTADPVDFTYGYWARISKTDNGFFLDIFAVDGGDYKADTKVFSGSYTTHEDAEEAAELWLTDSKRAKMLASKQAAEAHDWNNWIGRSYMGFPGSQIISVSPSEDYLMRGPINGEARATMVLRLEDGREVTLPIDLSTAHRQVLGKNDRTAARKQAAYMPGVDCPMSESAWFSDTAVSSAECPQCGQTVPVEADPIPPELGDGKPFVLFPSVHLLPGKTLNDRVGSRKTAASMNDLKNMMAAIPAGVGRDLDTSQLLSQIGRGNVLAISGGRVMAITAKDTTVGIYLPISNGYGVNVFLDANDTYIVQRVYRGKVMGQQDNVYAEEVGEAAYQASSFRSNSFGGHTVASMRSHAAAGHSPYAPERDFSYIDTPAGKKIKCTVDGCNWSYPATADAMTAWNNHSRAAFFRENPPQSTASKTAAITWEKNDMVDPGWNEDGEIAYIDNEFGDMLHAYNAPEMGGWQWSVSQSGPSVRKSVGGDASSLADAKAKAEQAYREMGGALDLDGSIVRRSSTGEGNGPDLFGPDPGHQSGFADSDLPVEVAVDAAPETSNIGWITESMLRDPDLAIRAAHDPKFAWQVAAAEGPCWDGYEMVGMKEKDGETVPNCVPSKKSSSRTAAENPFAKKDKKENDESDETPAEEAAEEATETAEAPATPAAEPQTTGTAPTAPAAGVPAAAPGSDPASMQVGDKASMSYTMANGGNGSVEVVFIREDNGVYFFNGPTGEFGIANTSGTWQDADGNSFSFASTDGSAPQDQAMDAKADPNAQPQPQPDPSNPATPDDDPTKKKSSRRTAAEVKRFEDGHSEWKCGRCNATVYRYPGEGDVSCSKCDAQYNAFGQRLRDDWADNQSNWDDEVSDMEGYERQYANDDGRYASRRTAAVDVQENTDAAGSWLLRATVNGRRYELRAPSGGRVNEPTIDYQYSYNYPLYEDGVQVDTFGSTASDPWIDVSAAFYGSMDVLARTGQTYAEALEAKSQSRRPRRNIDWWD